MCIVTVNQVFSVLLCFSVFFGVLCVLLYDLYDYCVAFWQCLYILILCTLVA